MSVVRIRLSLRGCTNRPFYHIVVANSKWKRDGKHIEQVRYKVYLLVHLNININAMFISSPKVGCYDPMPNNNQELVVGLNLDRIR